MLFKQFREEVGACCKAPNLQAVHERVLSRKYTVSQVLLFALLQESKVMEVMVVAMVMVIHCQKNDPIYHHFWPRPVLTSLDHH